VSKPADLASRFVTSVAWRSDHLGANPVLTWCPGKLRTVQLLAMKRRYAQFNPKRRLITPAQAQARSDELKALAARARYGGNPEHKKNPGDFGLTPPSDPRQGKSLCDAAKVFRRADAEAILKGGLQRGTVSDRMDGEWPKNVWSVTEDGIAMEAQLENPELGSYHGYPMPETDPLSQEVLRRWARADG